uniref:Uncharacterized protein n=1 Tax=Octopus bimaculoides TaxID=37653 RepID=A0A0L8HIA1_OCTBM
MTVSVKYVEYSFEIHYIHGKTKKRKKRIILTDFKILQHIFLYQKCIKKIM